MDFDAAQWRTILAASQRSAIGKLRSWSAYYEGRQSLSYMDPELVAEMGHRIRPVILNWPRLVVDSLEERLDVEGFRLAGEARADSRMWDWWQANDLDEQSQQAHIDALVESRSFVIVGAPDSGDVPVITVESAQQVTASFDPRTRKVRAALKSWSDVDSAEDFATLYLPDVTLYYRSGPGKGGVFEEYDRDEHGMGVVPVVPIVNRPRTLAPEGVSELADVVPLSDAACKVATDMMIGAEFHAMPRRWVVGMGPEDFVDADGHPVSEWSRIAGRVWANKGTPQEVEMGQFPEADLSNFHSTINALAKLTASMAGLAPHVLGMATENPASADAIRSAETRLIKRAERRQRAFGGSWERVMRIAARVMDGSSDPSLSRLETVWRDAATPTVGQAADAAVKLHAERIVPTRQTREDLGYSQETIAAMEAEDAKSVDRILSGDLSSLVGPKPVPTPPAG